MRGFREGTQSNGCTSKGAWALALHRQDLRAERPSKAGIPSSTSEGETESSLQMFLCRPKLQLPEIW